MMQYLIQQLCSVFSWDLCKNPVFQSAKKSKYYLERSYLEMPFCMYNISSRSLPVQRSYFPSYTCNEVKLLCIIDSMKLSTSDNCSKVCQTCVCLTHIDAEGDFHMDMHKYEPCNAGLKDQTLKMQPGFKCLHTFFPAVYLPSLY